MVKAIVNKQCLRSVSKSYVLVKAGFKILSLAFNGHLG